MLFLRPLGENILRYEHVCECVSVCEYTCVCVDLARKNGALYSLDKALTRGYGEDIVEINLCHCFAVAPAVPPVKHN